MSRGMGAQVRVDYTKIRGGLDLVSPAMSIAPGKPIYALNYEAGQEGGLIRIDGYERFDGSTAPSSGVYHYGVGVFSSGEVEFGEDELLFGGDGVLFGMVIEAGSSIVGETSGATGYVLHVEHDKIVFIVTSGTFAAESISVGGEAAGTFSSAPVSLAAPSSYDNAVYLNETADYYRSFITKPDGSGPIRGGGELNGTVYVFRDNAAATHCNLFKSSTDGWTVVELFSEISFDTGLVAVADGDTITQATSGATATAKRAVLESGAWGTDAAGRLILDDVAGDFDDFGDLYVDATLVATATSVVTPITIQPGGKYETVNYNFYGGSSTYRMYGCSGVDYGFEFDGTTYVPIHTGMTTDTPTHIACHKKHLFFSFGASLQFSSPGVPYEWSPLTGASEIGMGDTITALTPLPGKVLGVFGEHGTYQLIGSGVDDFELDNISAESGGLAYTTQNIVGSTLTFGIYGINKVASTADYGNFAQSSVSKDVQPLIDLIKTKVVASSVYKARNQYRIYGSDGSGLCLTSSAERSGLDYVSVYYITNFQYPIGVYNVFNSVGGNVYICSDDGWLYQADKGSSFDGEEIESYFHLMFNHMNSPTTMKSYNRAVIEATAEGYAEIKAFPDFSYSNPRHPQHIIKDETIYAIGGRWDTSNWDTFFWDSVMVTTISMPIRGNGENIAIIGYSSSDIDLGHRVDGVTLHYIPRRVSR